MIRALPFLFVLSICACAEFPQIDAATPANVDPRPPYLTGGELAAANAVAKTALAAPSDARADALRQRADALRAR